MVSAVREFVEFWLENSVHADEQFGAKRGRMEVDRLVESLLQAAEGQASPGNKWKMSWAVTSMCSFV
jgi:hypothetical protein